MTDDLHPALTEALGKGAPTPPTTMFAPMEPGDLRFLVSRLPGDVRKALLGANGNLHLGGGAIRSIFGAEEVNDYDFFCATRAFAVSSASAAERKMREEGPVRRINTRNAVTLAQRGRTTWQFITRWQAEDATDLCAQFDFTVCQAALSVRDGKFYGMVSERFYADLAARRLVYTAPAREEAAGGSILRAVKLARRGYSLPPDTLAALIARTAAQWDPRGIPLGQYILARLQEVDPSMVIDGLPEDPDAPIDGLPDD